ncbi:hypothetical protein B0H17DRAFT_1208056 [Mycena rosella]|uniref:Uncharacterized protein n=1 Tax=Mycena rosella TaxID=1033263 RepID=A0AAD7D2Z3_MYCRO|nr:hypothetical protein B0H17DRAFT_1208056 [Mycena rosella]
MCKVTAISKAVGRNLQLLDLARPFRMLKYFPVGILAWYAAVALTLGSVMPSKTVSALFRTCYKWNSARTGVALSVSTTIGGVLGEVVSGPVIDKLMERSRKREGRVRPESRLHGMWPAIFLLPAGLLMFGFCIENHDLNRSYIGAAVVMAVTCFAVQMITTPIVACDKVGFQVSGITYASVSMIFFLPVLWIMLDGERLRGRLGEPAFNKGI